MPPMHSGHIFAKLGNRMVSASRDYVLRIAEITKGQGMSTDSIRSSATAAGGNPTFRRTHRLWTQARPSRTLHREEPLPGRWQSRSADMPHAPLSRRRLPGVRTNCAGHSATTICQFKDVACPLDLRRRTKVLDTADRATHAVYRCRPRCASHELPRKAPPCRPNAT